MACVNVIAADTDAEAAKLATSVQILFKGIVTGQRRLLQPPVDSMEGIWTAQEEAAARQMLTYSFIGSAAKIKKDMERFIADTGVNEVMASSHIYNHEARINSYHIFADVMKQIKATEALPELR